MFGFDIEDSCVVICCLLLCYYIVRTIRSRTTYPSTVTIEHIIRVPIEDQVDLAIEDRHNVHNKTIKRTATQVIEQLKECDQHHYTIDSTVNLIEQMIELSIDTDVDKLDSALYTLQTICRIDAIYHSANIREKEILRLVWERINHPLNHEVVEQLKTNLIEQLADCRSEYAGVHCCEGRIMRVLQTLENCDKQDLVNLRPMWAYREEISDKISKYRDKLLSRAPKEYTDLESKMELTDHDRKLLDQFNRCLIKNLDTRFEMDYISPGLLTKNELCDLTRVYYESLYDTLS
jgi:hypothetical protein